MKIAILLSGIMATLYLYKTIRGNHNRMISDKAPLGVRNNNPLNIRTGNDWQGEVNGHGSGFEAFKSVDYGFRAAAILLRNYRKKYGLTTVREIIHRWAPNNENNTDAYVNLVSSKLGVNENEMLDVTDDNTLARLMLAMSVMENGKGWFTLSQAKKGVKLANE